MPVRRALLSCSDRTGLIAFARGLTDSGVELVASGGTGKALAEAGLPVTPVETVTGSPEMMDGRVKTLHPKIHGGLLALRDNSEHMRQAEAHGIGLIDLVAVNLYPFRETVAKPGVTLEEAVENIDIGGPSMIRSAAKNWKSVAVIVDPGDYAAVLQQVQTNDGELTDDMRLRLATKAFGHTAAYDAAIHNYFEARGAGGFPEALVLDFERVQTLRYGENPHQQAAFYRERNAIPGSIGRAKQLSGRELSFINLMDAEAALNLVREFADPAASIIKHTNPCGCATAPQLVHAFEAARDADPISRFGGIIALNRPLDLETAEAITVKNSFYEVLIAPGFDEDAVDLILNRKGWGEKIRLLQVEGLNEAPPPSHPVAMATWDYKPISGGLLVQEADRITAEDDGWTVVTKRAPTEEEAAALRFVWRVCLHVKSNAVALARAGLNPEEPEGEPRPGYRLVGMGAGQPNRVLSTRIAIEQANELARGAVLASDAFFPKPDGPETAAEAGITAIIQPGGSVEDEKAIEVCNRYDVAMVFTGRRHFRH
ncbi:MAG: bifunctional phosphoribosylaminoimidazolecarboxamide formyltransferase/IMP cyclohydrolase [Armatimonadetes bacterium]|nr:bifunctional phosphoribosylaminoimidazolecarboxamide formyltransferase/IMP cyclohydrolase [Armatimonadota bacterium]